ncbi:anthranilate synthase component II [Desulfatitalea alkaliphila]|uniref:Aminodeoxychorismate/anthranilate synthase component II n=1 Tax=Desulfatitalea alkaliphila TaxID=2929485 RepID=A0AA41R1S6_9BACT|nr:aminodeoxychorismate/anthranilate synthase component II [Desulfatitalea alkaliphila]MCJ8500136.1 aminodeoxychorismate/anthranilate synthase component II [Desulfatitalea alkaliphila]
MILMIDNYDSFTYNLVQYLEEIGASVEVVRNDVMDAAAVEALAPSAIVISPGPGGPPDAGVSLAVIERLSGRIPILGVCLGHQCIAAAFGAAIIGARRLMHGKTSTITGDGEGLFSGVKQPFQAMRYHSLVVDPGTVPPCLKVSATAEDGEIMGLRHTHHLTEGIQFHPESIMTTIGKRLLRNFVKRVGASE